MQSVFEPLLERKLLFISGKGGAGKSTFSTLLAHHAASLGKRVLLVEQTGKPLLPFFLEENCQGITYQNLSLRVCFKEFVCDHLRQPFLYEKVFDNDSIRTFLKTIPGLAEAMIIGKFYFTLEKQNPRKHDMVIFDCPASGHFYNLLMTPATIRNSSLGGPFIDYISTFDTYIRSDAVASVFVTLPEPLVATETSEYISKILDEGFKLDMVIKNKWHSAEGFSNKSDENHVPDSLGPFLQRDMKNQAESETILSKVAERMRNLSVSEVKVCYESMLKAPIKRSDLGRIVNSINMSN